MAEPLRGLEDDGLYLPEIKAHSLEKIAVHNYYADEFTKSMRVKWPQRAYVGLYSGAGRARLVPSGEIVETTAMSALRLPVPFTKYIFVDNEPRCAHSLRQRIAASGIATDYEVIEADVREVGPAVARSLPAFDRSHRLLSLCFVDPFAANLPFDTIRYLARFRMDFLILLMLGLDARLNFRRYLFDERSTRIADLVDCPTWREDWRREEWSERHVVRFLLQKFDDAMVRLGYLTAAEQDYYRVKVRGKGVMQYILILYSRNDLGQKFWGNAVRGVDQQTRLPL
jgi:three-Cys-motif partner protein